MVSSFGARGWMQMKIVRGLPKGWTYLKAGPGDFRATVTYSC